MVHFKERELPIKKLFVNGLTGITAAGLSDVINCCRASLRVYEGAFMDQEGMNGTFCGPLSHCFELEFIDLTGDSNVGDDGINLLPKGEIKNEDGKVLEIHGLPKLREVKLCGLVKMSDHGLLKLTQTTKVLEHLEVTKCELLTEYSIDNILKANVTLQFIELSGIPGITPQILDNLKLIRPDVLIRRYQFVNIDPKDNGLRVPRRIVDKKKKKKKGKKGGKKKK